jgi:hypothetical protein
MDIEFSVGKRKAEKAPFAVVYGPSGTGKTSLAASAEKSVFIQTEDGGGELDITTLKDGLFTSYDEILAALRFVYKNPNGVKHVIIDSLDHMEPLVWKHVCEKNSWDSIETPGYGKGYIECDDAWRKIISALIKIRDDHNIGIICIAHDVVRTVNDPTTDTYDAHELKLHKRAVALWKESCDMIGLLKNRVVVDAKTGKGKGGTSPSLFVRPTAGFTAKTRFREMPAFIPIELETGWADVAKFIPFYNKTA